jgi:serine/threonine protein kinase
MSPSAGEILDSRFQLISLLGRGGMGDVYRAFDSRTGRHVAVKVIRREFADDPAYRDRFEMETQAAIQIEHPNVIPIYDRGNGIDLYIVMRLVTGSDLGQRLRSRAE